MMFYDFTTANQFRKRAEDERKKALLKLVRTVIAHPETHEKLIADNASDWLTDGILREYMRETPLTNCMLNRSGFVFPSPSGDSVHDAILTSDNHTEDYALIDELRRVGMTGGIDSAIGRIHT